MDSTGKVSGDFEAPDKNMINELNFIYTPVPNGIGPITVSMLLRNLLICWIQNNEETLNQVDFVQQIMYPNVNFR